MRSVHVTGHAATSAASIRVRVRAARMRGAAWSTIIPSVAAIRALPAIHLFSVHRSQVRSATQSLLAFAFRISPAAKLVTRLLSLSASRLLRPIFVHRTSTDRNTCPPVFVQFFFDFGLRLGRATGARGGIQEPLRTVTVRCQLAVQGAQWASGVLVFAELRGAAAQLSTRVYDRLRVSDEHGLHQREVSQPVRRFLWRQHGMCRGVAQTALYLCRRFYRRSIQWLYPATE